MAPSSETVSSLAHLRQQVVGIDTKVPLLDGSEIAYINLDNAASTPVLQGVLDTIDDFMFYYSSVHRGTGFKSGAKKCRGPADAFQPPLVPPSSPPSSAPPGKRATPVPARTASG